MNHHKNVGHLQAWLLRCSELNPIAVTNGFICLMRKSFSSSGSFGSRSCSKTSEHNTYAGCRGLNCDYIAETPSQGPKTSSLYPYYRQNFDHRYTPGVNRVMNELAGTASYSARIFDPIMTGLLSSDMSSQEKIYICRTAIVTFGRQYHGFFNSLHVDSTDLYSKKLLLQSMEEVRSGLESQNEVMQQKSYYAYTFMERFGLSVPTTCVYQFVHDHVSERAHDFEVFQYFVSLGLGLCIRLSDHIAHGFYGANFVHCTPMPLIRVGNILYFKFDSYFNVFAWGAS